MVQKVILCFILDVRIAFIAYSKSLKIMFSFTEASVNTAYRNILLQI